MCDPEDQVNPINEDRTPQAEQTDRVNGEYHYRNGYTQRIYSDAHYVREDETTVPPRYYTPPEKPVREGRAPGKKKTVGLGALIALCLVCALLGGLCGGAVAGSLMDSRMDKLETNLAELGETASKPVLVQAAPGTTVAKSSDDGSLSAGDIYDMACEQVVGVTTQVTGTNLFGMPVSGAVTGSGFIISENGYILTNYHVVEEANKGKLDVTVILHDGTQYTAQIVAFEEENDVAVLKIEAEGLNAAVIGDSDSLRVGDTVYAVGNPLGELEFSMTTGHVSAKDRSITTDNSGESISMFQIDAPVNNGNSGGPVYNGQGQVVGIVTAKYSSTGVEGIGFAIPINDAANIANDLITKGYVTGKARLGVIMGKLESDPYKAAYFQYNGWPMGVYIGDVTPGSCAEKAGIEAGDIITKFDGETVEGFDDLKAAVKRHSAGDQVELEVYRADESRIVTVILDEDTPD